MSSVGPSVLACLILYDTQQPFAEVLKPESVMLICCRMPVTGYHTHNQLGWALVTFLLATCAQVLGQGLRDHVWMGNRILARSGQPAHSFDDRCQMLHVDWE